MRQRARRRIDRSLARLKPEEAAVLVLLEGRLQKEGAKKRRPWQSAEPPVSDRFQ